MFIDNLCENVKRIRRIRTLYALLRTNPTDSLAKCVDLFYKRTNPNGFIRFEPIIRMNNGYLSRCKTNRLF